MFFATVGIDQQASCNGECPGINVGSLQEPAACRVELHQRLLKQLLRFRFVLGLPQQVPTQAGGQRGMELAEGGLVAIHIAIHGCARDGYACRDARVVEARHTPWLWQVRYPQRASHWPRLSRRNALLRELT